MLTVGAILRAMGKRDEAREAFERARHSSLEKADFERLEEAWMGLSSIARDAGDRGPGQLEETGVLECFKCGRLWANFGIFKKSSMKIEDSIRSFRLAMRLGQRDSNVYRCQEVLADLGQLADEGCGPQAVKTFLRGAEIAKSKMPPGVLDAQVELMRQDRANAARDGGKVLVVGCFIQGNTPTGRWDGSALDSGIGGSEQAVIHLSARLQARGWQVEIYGRPVRSGRARDGTLWLPWDYASPMLMAKSASKRFIWLHDTVQEQAGYDHLMKQVDGVLVLSDFHASLLPDRLKRKAIITQNGVDEDMFTDGPNLSEHFIYASMPSRGLLHVLKAWTTIRRCLGEVGKNATLSVLYGFTQHDHQLASKDPVYKEWMAHVSGAMEKMKDEGVNYYGMVSHSSLAHLLSQAGFYLYPTVFPETSCIALMKAQLTSNRLLSQIAGAIPITSRFEGSAIPETAGLFDLGQHPVGLVNGTGSISLDWLKRWTKTVCEAAGASGEARVRSMLERKTGQVGMTLEGYRRSMKEWARHRFSWNKVASEWDDILKNFRN
ncbi:hypothetical protein GUITHDRAFT_142974 [Guillardia theta CCMP2712]|uniref:Glycosyl transferase family 1 domain-containing protein n=1 Tax=Guillardia theta (strain CCMP2712) TaxID=905079 RepID=L1IVK1_GUITC|nr:hypothetical protein GUITHDRAFT_142974 [Guillardia theta CCMP2712]EKX40263.1 hypothetical protein GUITHDRAFT_142974 [Guillardia theta CCMP2712]|eukprot:XP_005827243.1 hypothetical protein GUITHDRAFT_142974 [Guillardia theta CCMP2712]